jgi:predicted  nucleic acid-binding Zn-ribbon protein
MRFRFTYKCTRCGKKYFGYCPNECEQCGNKDFYYVAEADDMNTERNLEIIHKG